VPTSPGTGIFTLARKLAHRCGPITHGKRLALTAFIGENLAKDAAKQAANIGLNVVFL